MPEASKRHRNPGTPERHTNDSLHPLRVLIADDHRLMVEALQRVLAEREDIEVVGHARDGAELLSLLGRTRPDVVLLDIGMPEIDGIEAAARIRGRLPDVRILMLTAYGHPEAVQAAERAGADGYILKSAAADDLIDMLVADEAEGFLVAGFRALDEGVPELTAREREVLQAVSDGLTNREIGGKLWITEQTVKFHLKNLFRKLGASNRAEAVELAREQGLVWTGERRAGVPPS
jgi:DNA-binding NarL/FixJ family response regulator